MNKAMFALGLVIVLAAAALLLLNVITSGIAVAIEMLGIGLIAVSKRPKIKGLR